MKISKKGIILLVIAIAGIIFIVNDYSQQANQRLSNAAGKSETGGSLDTDGKSAKEVFEGTLKASNDKDVKTYVTYLIPKARKNTEEQLSKFFKSQDVTNTLQSYRVLKKENGHLLAEAKIKSINNNTNDQKKYRNHIATINVSYVKDNGKWLIDLTTTTNTEFLDKK